MGTSTSSKGAPSGVSFDPPWLDDVPCQPVVPLGPGVDGGTADTPDDPNTDGAVDPITPTPAIAPRGRYAGTRINLTKFLSSGSMEHMRRALSSFTGKGLGGASRAAQRMRVTSRASSSLGSFLAAARDGTSVEVNAWIASVHERELSLHDIALELVEKIIPEGGSIDEESAKNAIAEAIARFYELHEGVDIFALSNDQICELMGLIIGYDVYHRIGLEFGRSFERLRYTVVEVRARLNDMLEYVLSIAVTEIGKLRSEVMTQASLMRVADIASRKSFEVFLES